MGRWWKGGKWPVMILILHVVGILIFTRGFLLTRTELPYYSQCSDLSESPCVHPDTKSGNQNCWTKPAVDRLIIIVLDALRFDFVAPSSFFPESKPWMDKLPVLQKLASSYPLSARIFKAIADPPTTSLQRLKGLTTGALPTFIDVGNSFGAPAIVEDNFIYQLVENGKRVVMMGDDTWVQLFPDHFNRSYPYPSFNVKDLDTVDNGCIEHLLPSLHQDDWDVLIAHFLGVDHAGHIFGVDSTPMVEKLEQYNTVLEKIVEVLFSQSGPGGLHENTFLVVMGDHGQTLNGDHGGGSAEEVETTMFAMSFKDSPVLPSEFDSSMCELDLNGKKICISSIQQLDFAVTVNALLGIPFPFGSIGSVNPQLFALGASTRNMEGSHGSYQDQLKLEEWMRSYVNVLCINSWQVKRYIDIFSASSLIGFSTEDVSRITDLYAKADNNWSSSIKNLLVSKNESHHMSIEALKSQILYYHNFLSVVAEVARSKWTEFNLKMMSIGLGIMVISLFIHFLSIKRVNKAFGNLVSSSGDSGMSFGWIFASFMVMIRAASFLSNSYILEEGKVANFLLSTTALVMLRYSLMKKKMALEAIIFILLMVVLRVTIDVGLSKQAVTSQFMSASPSWLLGINLSHPVWTSMTELLPVLALIGLAYFLYLTVSNSSSWGISKYVISGTIISYFLIALHWTSESDILAGSFVLQGIQKNYIPWTVYAIGSGQILVLALDCLFGMGKTSNGAMNFFVRMVAMLSACSSTIIILSGKQGPVFALASVLAGYCIMRLEVLCHDNINGADGAPSLNPLPVVQWSLLAVCLFFATGHWCAFDGLRYGAAFIGFDEFVLVRQAILLTIETFGFSHILSLFGLPILVAHQYLFRQAEQKNSILAARLIQVFMIYGLIAATTTTATILCVTIQRRHLMVWGLFAPKFVFDVVGLILTDILTCLASIYYLNGLDDNTSH